MTMTCIEKLLSISSEPLCGKPQVIPDLLTKYPLGTELFHMLELKNGFYAFESALHVFPASCELASGFDLETWNSDSLWRNQYQDFGKGLLFFAEDILQDQFCLSSAGVVRFAAETGAAHLLADSVEDWCCLILSAYRYETGWPLASQWQGEYGPLPRGKRLMPKIPFFLGGSYELENLWAGDAVRGMRFKADLAIQTRNVPDGTKVKLHVLHEPEGRPQ